MKDKTYIGIDPGQTGAIAFIYTPGDVAVYDFDDPGVLSELIAQASEGFCKAVLEKVASHPGEGVSSAFRFGTAYGIWIGRLEALRIPFDYVSPQRWKKAMFDVKPPDKAASITRALRIYPQMADMLKRKKDHGRAEALLIAEYCRIHDK